MQHHIDMGILDLSKAYNRVWRDSILKQLKNWGLDGRISIFIENFLSNRHFQVAIGGSLSQPFCEETGVPQGSVLAVTMFLIAMNKVFNNLPKNMYAFAYADDIVLVTVGKSYAKTRRKLQNAIRTVSKWADGIGFVISPEKSNIFHVCHSNHRAHDRVVKLNENVIPFRKFVTILGVTFDRALSFKRHFQIVKEDCRSRLRLLTVISSRHRTNNRQTIIRVGNSIVLSKLLYGIEITCRNFDLLVSTLAPIYNTIIKKASGHMPSSPINSCMIESGCLPFNLKAAQALADRTISFLEKTSGDETRLLQHTNQILTKQFQINLPNIAEVSSVGDRRWDQPSPTIDWSIKKKVRAGDNPLRIRIIFNELVNRKYVNHDKIYTDGSKSTNGVGAGVFSSTHKVSAKLSDSCSVFSAEVAALNIAIDSIPNNQIKESVIFTDSASALKALETGRSKHPWIKRLDSKDLSKVTFIWIPGHSGITGNEEADKLAGIGYDRSYWKTDVPGDDLKNWIENIAGRSWELSWNQERHLFTRKIKGTVARWEDRDNRKEQRVLSRMRVGHTRVTHCHYTGSNQRPECDVCNTYLTVEHILTECPIYEHQRMTSNLPDGVRNILANDKESEDKVLDFLKATNLLDQI